MTQPDNKLPSRWLVSTDWLEQHLGKPDVSIVDGSYYLPTQKRDPVAEYSKAHIPGAVFFDIETVADHSTDLPHMLPGPDQFSEAVSALGIGRDDTIVVYDTAGLMSAARVWWTFRIFGAKKVFILDGGLPKWQAEGRKVEAGDVKRDKREFKAEMDTSAVANSDDVLMAFTSKNSQVVDARPAERFRGEASEPRPGVRSGHMPGAFNVPSSTLIENGRLVSPEKIAAAFKAGGVDIDKPIITSCGSGVTAAILTLALDAVGKKAESLYDGSWSEWGSRLDLPVESSGKKT
jgi:thiosulfate/3-mercaptopyruvate sulfurtransferase